MRIRQIIMLILWFGYFFWEWQVLKWTENVAGPIIRVDLLLIYPILFIGTLLAIYPTIRKIYKNFLEKFKQN